MIAITMHQREQGGSFVPVYILVHGYMRRWIVTWYLMHDVALVTCLLLHFTKITVPSAIIGLE